MATNRPRNGEMPGSLDASRATPQQPNGGRTLSGDQVWMKGFTAFRTASIWSASSNASTTGSSPAM